MSAVRTILTWGLVAAVASLVLAAGFDALRGGEDPEPAAATDTEPAVTGETEPAERTLDAAGADLRRAGVPEGRLVYSDEDCDVHAVALPDLAERPVHDLVACQSEGAAFAPPGGVRAECEGGRLTLWTGSPEEPELVARGRGCGAAPRPDGTVTFVRDGGIRRFVRCPWDSPSAALLCSEPVLTPAQLARQLRGPGWSRGPRIKELAWLDDGRFAAVVRGGPSDASFDYLVLFDSGRLVSEPVGPYRLLGGLEISPAGARVAAFETERGGIVAVDRNGRQIQLALDTGHAIAWSPDENWVAEATEGGIYVWRADDESPELIQIPVVARDLLWTGSPDDTEAALAEARQALRAAGVPEGILTYADEDCRSHELSLPGPGQAGSPLGYWGLCRYRAVVGGLVETLGPPRSPDLRVEAHCANGLLTLLKREFGVPEPRPVARGRGCGAAWKPDGTVTFVRDGGVRRFVRCPGDDQGMPLLCSTPVLTRSNLAGQLGVRLPAGAEPRVIEHVWLDGAHFAAIVRAGPDSGSFDQLILVERGRLVRPPTVPYPRLEGLRPSPTGRRVAAFQPTGGIVAIDRRGLPVRLAMDHGRAIAWSPNEKWIAEVDGRGIWVFRADGRGPEPIEIPILAQDVLWTRP